MKRISEVEAWRKWRAEERAIRARREAIKKANMELDLIADSLYADLAHQLATDPAGRKILHNFTGHTLRGWEIACGVDGRYIRMARQIGWDKFQRIIALARKMETW